jgi:hypothetical protein
MAPRCFHLEHANVGVNHSASCPDFSVQSTHINEIQSASAVEFSEKSPGLARCYQSGDSTIGLHQRSKASPQKSEMWAKPGR